MRLPRGDFSINFRVDGPDGAPWVTFSNSLVCSLGMWDGQVDRLADRFRILRYDQRGHGDSDAPVPPYSIDDLAADVVALWDHLDIERSHVVGLSLGGMTGIALALDYPERVASLTAADCRAEADETYAAMFRGRIATTQRLGMEALVEPTLGRFFTPDFAVRAPATLGRYGAMIRSTKPDGHVGCCEAIATARYQDRLGDLAVPTLFMGGRHDIGAPVEIMRQMHERVPGSRHLVLESAGHISCEEDPDGFADALADHCSASTTSNRLAGRTREKS